MEVWSFRSRQHCSGRKKPGLDLSMLFDGAVVQMLCVGRNGSLKKLSSKASHI